MLDKKSILNSVVALVLGTFVVTVISSIYNSVGLLIGFIKIPTLLLSILKFKIPVYIVLISMVILFILYVIIRKRKHRIKVAPPDWLKFRKINYDGLWFQWSYDNKNRPDLDSFTAICECGCILSQKETDSLSFDELLYCPKCKKEYPEVRTIGIWRMYEDVKRVVIANINNGDYKKYIESIK